jgi:hypothetical protein
LGEPISQLQAHHFPWGDTELWLPRLTIRFPDHVVEVFLGEVHELRRGDPTVNPSATNIVVMFDPTELPRWVEDHRSQNWDG